MFKILDGRSEFYQWDLDRKLIVSDPTITEVHFCNKTDNCSLVCEVYEQDSLHLVNVPNILLQNNWDIRVYGYCGDCYTKQYARFKVVGRTKPADYVYTETEVKSWEELEKRCYEVLDTAEALAYGAVSGKSFMDYQALVEELNAAEQSKYHNPQHFYIKTMGVPDVWVYEVVEEKVNYEYVDDDTFAQALVNSTVQVGYFVLSALETQKVDLTNYVQNTDYATGSNAGVVKVSTYYGTDVASGIVRVARASGTDIDERTNNFKPIVPMNLNFAVLKALTEPTVGGTQFPANWTDERKSKARTTLGIEDNFVKKSTQNSGKLVYAKYNGSEVTIPVNNISSLTTNLNGQIPFYSHIDGSSQLFTSTPTKSYSAVNKKYVDDLIADLQAQINALKGN